MEESLLREFVKSPQFQRICKELGITSSMAKSISAERAKKKADDELTPDDFPDTRIERRGQHIIVPELMPYRVAVSWMERHIEQEETYTSINEPVHAYPLEGAHAFAQALAEIYGFTQMVPTFGFFGDNPPGMIRVQTGVDTFVEVPWGAMIVPEIEGRLATGVTRLHGRPVFQITGQVKHKHLHKVKEIADLTRRNVLTKSIYKGQALRMKFPDYSAENFDPSTDAPKFVDVRDVDTTALIFGKTVQDQIDVSIFTPILKTALCKANGIPLKRGILLHGKWGVGKTLTAHVAAALCVQNGWTFIYLEQTDQLARAIEFARPYDGEVMIFGEDFDRIAEKRTDILNHLLNTIDGVDSKKSNIMVVLTTNALENIDASSLRPGRLDAIIEVTPPDADAAIRLVRRYAGNLLPVDVDLADVGTTLNGMIPAVIREVVERSKLAAIHRLEDGDMLALEADDLLIAAKGMAAHLELLEPEEEDERSDFEKGMENAAEIIRDGIADALAYGSNGEHAERLARQREAVKG